MHSDLDMYIYVLFVLSFIFSTPKVVAKNLMPDSSQLQSPGPWTESRLNSVRIVWPSMQYIDACREDM